MKKLAFLMAAMLLLGALALTACDSQTPDETEGNTVAETPTTGETVGKTDAPTEAPTESQKVTYTVTVVDQDGTPVAGVRVQMCKDELCMLPKSTDESGVATFSEDEAVYRAKLASLPEGYTGDMETYHDFPAGSTEVTITVQKANG